MTITFTIHKNDITNFEKFLEGISQRVENLEDAEDSLRTVMEEDLRRRFASSPVTTSGGNVYGGEYWKPLSESYLRMRPERATGQIYVDTAALRNSLTVSKNFNQISELTGDTYVFGTRISYAGKLEALSRPIVFWHPTLLEELSETLLQYYITPLESGSFFEKIKNLLNKKS